MISSYNTSTSRKKTGNPHGLKALQNVAAHLSQKQGAYLCISGPVNEISHPKNGSILACIWKSSLWSQKVALKCILEFRVGRFALDQEADLCPKGTDLCSSCYGTASIFVC